MEICSRFIVSLYVLCFGKFRASGDNVVNCFLKLPTDSALRGGAIFQDLVSVVVGLDALILGSSNETFWFWFEARCTQHVVVFFLVFFGTDHAKAFLPICSWFFLKLRVWLSAWPFRHSLWLAHSPPLQLLVSWVLAQTFSIIFLPQAWSLHVQLLLLLSLSLLLLLLLLLSLLQFVTNSNNVFIYYY